ncbi:DUF6049 family protein [Nonomuraea gerenzanensis]|uniref:Probable secreted protein n=1 Tax=Nonomuraea gerenzanensis TaxID=93944 RepID=A0A1M4DX63_9ACTN|nr:DUF6049 family protein [Nonomuraea gerenzanensis]UBU13443.1 DUF6049 family protein [Nonomuraea gerenzanensis]SBO91104.1 probable secreted protein [Nonomuraea gerenzanensis]
MIRKATLLAALSAALLAPLVAVTPGSAAAKAAVTAQRQSYTVSISSITPEAPRNLTDEIKITGTVRNDTGADTSGLQVRLRYLNQRFADRATMATYLSDQNTATLPSSVSTRNSFMDLPPLAAGGTAQWTITATPVQLGLSTFGVYPIAVDVAQYSVPQAAVRTVLTYAPATPQKLPRNRIAIALPVIDQPHRATDDAAFVDDKLSQSLAGRGRLADLARIAQSAPATVTWVFDPALLDDVSRMTKGYTVKTKDGEEKKPASAEATAWLTTMRSALAASPVVATPYADPDVAALAHQGLDTQTHRAIELGGQTARTLLNRNATTNLNWPADGVLDPDALDLLSVSDVDTVLLNATNLPPQQPVTTTPDGAATLDSVNGPVTALVADAELSRLFEPASSTSTLLSTQRFIAETAMIAAEPGQTAPRSLVVAPSRRWNPNPTLVTALIKTAGKLPWLQPVKLESIKPGKGAVPRAGLTYTDQDRKEELSRKYLDPVKDVWSKSQLTSLIMQQKTQSRFDAAVLRLTSSAWRNSTRAGRSVTSEVKKAVDDRLAEIKITGASPDSPKTLAGSNGVVPISVKNELGVPIELYIDIKSDNPELLTVNFAQPEPLTIGGGQSGTVQVQMNAAPDTSGDATVTVQLKTADGQPYGKPQRLTIRTTGYTGIALVIVGAALTVMLAAVVTRLLRRRSQRKLARAAKNRESESV